MRFLEKNFALCLFLSLLVGLVFPQLAQVPTWLVPFTLAIVILISCAKISLADLKQISFSESLFFYITRYLALPVGLYLLCKPLLGDLAAALLLLALLPAGAAAPAATNVVNGNILLTLGIVVVSSLLAPFVLPGAFWLLEGQAMAVNILGMFMTTGLMIFVPLALYFGICQKIAPVKNLFLTQGKALTTLLIAFGIAVVVAKQRDVILSDPLVVVQLTALAAGVFVITAVMGWFFPYYKRPTPQLRRTYTTVAWCNNLTLGISLALLYLPPAAVVFVILAEIPWILGFALSGKFAQRS